MNSKTTPYDEDRNQKHIRLAEAYQKGNVEAAGKLLADFQPLLRKLAYDPIRQTFDEDLSQQLALVFLEKTKMYDAEKLPIFALYIKQQLKWGKIDWQRKEITYAKAECFDVDHSPEPVVNDPAIPMSEAERAQLIEDIAAHLRENQKALFRSMAAGLSSSELQTQYALTPQSLWNKRHRIRERLLKAEDLRDRLEELREETSILPNGYVDRHDFLFAPSLGE